MEKSGREGPYSDRRTFDSFRFGSKSFVIVVAVQGKQACRFVHFSPFQNKETKKDKEKERK